MSIFAAFIIALIIALLFRPYKNRNSLQPLAIFFLILFLAGVAGGFWIFPFGPIMWGVSWLPLLFIVLLVAFLLSVSPPRHVRRTEAGAAKEAAATAESLSVFIWLLLIVLLIAALSGYFWGPGSPPHIAK